MRRLLVLLVAALLLAGCSLSTDKSGVVESRHRNYTGKTWVYKVCIRTTNGGSSCGFVKRSSYDRCKVGDRWPNCRKESK